MKNGTDVELVPMDAAKTAYLHMAIKSQPPKDESAAGEYWFRQGILWEQERVARLQYRSSKLETDPAHMLLLALKSARDHAHSKLRCEHLLELAIGDPSHSLSLALNERGAHIAFRDELTRFINAIDKDNPGGVDEPVATPAALRVFEDLNAGVSIQAAIGKEELPNWSRALLERHLPANSLQPSLL
jgi:hypothetical protein